jgi:methyl-accepting chemotaxis protein
MRISIKWKIFIGSIALSELIMLANIIYHHHVVEREQAAKNDLSPLQRRYDAYQRSAANDDAAAVDAWAISATNLRQALAKGDDDAARPIIAAMETSLRESIKPDFLVVIDKHGDATLSAGAPLSAGDVRSIKLFADVRANTRVRDQLLQHGNRTYVVNGIPISERDGGNIGAIVIGTRLERFFEEFRAQTEDENKRKIEIAFVANNGGACTAASFKPEDWPTVADAANKSPRETEREGGQLVEILRLGDLQYNFAVTQQNGYEGSGQGVVGKLYLLKSRADRIARLDKLLRDNLIVGAIGFVLALVLSFILAHGITRPLKKLISATEEIAHGRGDLTRRIDQGLCKMKDEIGELAENINAVFDNLHQLAAGVQNASLQVGASSAEISAASKQMLGGTKEQALKIESSTAAVTELSSSIQQVADNALQATKVAKESGDQVQAAIDGMSRIRATVEEAAEKIHELGESGKRIGNIVEVIRQISEQTTLLALNASIEAAHAGEQGRGFAVVANEVSSLAKRVGQSAKDIEDLIATIKDQTAEAVTSMQSGTSEVEGGTKIVTHTLGSLKQIVEVIQDTANAVQEQAVVSDEIARNMDAVQKIAQEVLASSEESVVQSENLHGLAHQLEESVRGFRVEAGVDKGDKPALAQGAKAALPAPERRKAARG